MIPKIRPVLADPRSLGSASPRSIAATALPPMTAANGPNTPQISSPMMPRARINPLLTERSGCGGYWEG